jgi:hypothetical protein
MDSTGPFGPLPLDLWQIPAGRNPSGEGPNFTDPPSQAPILSVGIYVLFPLMFVFFIARLYTRARLTGKLGMDDYLCVLACGSTFAYGGVLLGMLQLKPISPLGRHMWDIPVPAITNTYIKLIIMALVTSSVSLLFVKLTILALYHRIFQPSPWAFRLIWIGIIFVGLFYTITVSILLASCVPRSGQSWLLSATSGSCPSVQVRIALSQGIFGLISDVYILAIPIWQVSALSIKGKRKAGIIVVFLTGLLAVASSAGGLATRELVTLQDPNWLTTPYLFGLCEASIGLICSCMPVVTVALKSAVMRTVSSWNSAKKYSQTLLPKTERLQTPRTGQDQLPEIPQGNISGLRSFIYKFQRSNADITPKDNLSTLGTLNSEVDSDYHGQLRNMQQAHTEVKRLGSGTSEK